MIKKHKLISEMIIFMKKVFDVNTNENDFIEMSFKIELEYQILMIDIMLNQYIKY